MIVKIYDVDGNVDCFESANFQICPKSKMNKRILKAVVYTQSGKKVAKVSRHFKWYYKNFVYVPDPVDPNVTPVQAAPVATPVENPAPVEPQPPVAPEPKPATKPRKKSTKKPQA